MALVTEYLSSNSGCQNHPSLFVVLTTGLWRHNPIVVPPWLAQLCAGVCVPHSHVVRVPGGNDPTSAACDGGSGTWNPRRGEQWINGHFGNTLYNHYYVPNPKDKWDCGNGSHNKALSTARSYHPGGVNMLSCDGSVRFLRETISLTIWRALSTRSGGEIVKDF